VLVASTLVVGYGNYLSARAPAQAQARSQMLTAR
jgi:hypothetical protein